jgi:hypothetical protein
MFSGGSADKFSWLFILPIEGALNRILLICVDEILDNLKKHMTNKTQIASESSEHLSTSRIKNKTERDTFKISEIPFRNNISGCYT